MIKAPVVTSLEISKLSASQVQIRWDDVGSNFFYFVELAKTRETGGQVNWQKLGYTADNNWFDGTLQPLTYYKMRVSTSAEGFEPSDWIETEEFQSFEENAYTFELMNELTLLSKFVKEKFTLNNQNYVNFNKDVIWASLMSEDFTFSPHYENISSIENYIIKENEYHEVQGSIEKVCVDKDRTMVMEADGILYLFERYQGIVKVSNDRGQTWKAVKLLNDRVGNPVSRTCHYQTKTTSYILGYDRIFYGRKSSDVRWSADDVRFSANDVTFAKIGDQLNLGFDVEIYGTYARYPAEFSKIVESIAANDDYIYIVARDKVRFVKTKNAPIETDPTKPEFGDRIFEPETLTISGNPKAVTYKLDSVNGKVFALITGEVKKLGQDPTNPENVVDSVSKGVYRLQGKTWARVFGNSVEERRRIEHGYTSMSVNETEVFISSSNYRFTDSEVIEDTEVADKYPGVINEGVRYAGDRQFIHDKHYLMMSFRAGPADGYSRFKPGRMEYYAEPFFSSCVKSGTRCAIDNSDRVVVIYSNVVHSKPLDTYPESSPNRFIKEHWDKGDCTVVFPNVEFKNFTRYASGIMFYRYSGELIGYYEFNYRVRDEVRIVWKPTNVFLKAYLQNQTREEPWKPDTDRVRKDPDLRPLVTTMMPDSYLLQDSNFEAFCNYYLQYISDGPGTQYNNLLNLIRNKYPREKDSWQYLWSEVYKRNIYLSKEKRDDVSRFFETRKNDFYSTKGTEASYKFLFKLLYNEDVEIDIESKAGQEYDIIVESDNISEEVVGRSIMTATGRCNVTYIERNYYQGKLQWRITIHNMIGRFIAGQEITAENDRFKGMIVQGIRGKELAENNIEYINRGKSYYVMKIKSSLPTSRYRDDVLRFVHPVGFGFIGITLLTMFLNSGLNMKHTETIINKLKNYKFDAGLPSVWPDRVASLDNEGQIRKDPITGEPIYLDHPNKGQPFVLDAAAVTKYNTENTNSIISGQLPDKRRRPMSPLYDQSAVGYSQWRALLDERLKDNHGLPRDPKDPTQVKIND